MGNMQVYFPFKRNITKESLHLPRLLGKQINLQPKSLQNGASAVIQRLFPAGPVPENTFLFLVGVFIELLRLKESSGKLKDWVG